MATHPLAGQPAPDDMLINVPRLVAAYYTTKADPGDRAQRVSFGTSGHRGSSLDGTFTEDHIVAICQAIVEDRASRGVQGPLFLGMDTHALSEPAFRTAVEVFAAGEVQVVVDEGLGYTPTPVVSHAILVHNRERGAGARPLADGVVVTPPCSSPSPASTSAFPPTTSRPCWPSGKAKWACRSITC